MIYQRLTKEIKGLERPHSQISTLDVGVDDVGLTSHLEIPLDVDLQDSAVAAEQVVQGGSAVYGLAELLTFFIDFFI